MSDESFLSALERCDLPAEEFTHTAHLRAGYLYVRALGFEGAIDRMRRSIRAYAAHLGKPEKYHETITVAYLALIHERLRERGEGGGWEGFARQNQDLFARDLLQRYYPRPQLESELARIAFVLPRAV